MGDDDIFGVYNAGAASFQNTLNAGDVINAGDGIDTLYATLDAGALGVLPAAQYSNLENFYIRDVSGVAGAPTFNFATIAGEEQVWNDRSTSAVTVTGLAAGTTVGVNGANTAVSATNATYVNGATEAKIALNGGLLATVGAATGAVTINNAAGSTSLTTATLTSTNGTNNIAALNLPATVTSLTVDATTPFAITDGVTATLEGITATGLQTITVKGAGSVNLGSAVIPATVGTVNAAANSGGVTFALSNANTAVSNGVTFTGSTGNDVVTTNGLGGTMLSTASIDAGTGTADRLIVSATNDILIPATPLVKTQGVKKGQARIDF